MALAGVFIIINRFNRDVEALTVFSASYEKFDKAISSFSESLFTSNPADTSVTDDLERRSYSAFADLKTKASEKISSLVKHDADFMSTELDIADLSEKELDALTDYKIEMRNKRDHDLELLAKEFSDQKNKRKAVYGHFQELVELTK